MTAIKKLIITLLIIFCGIYLENAESKTPQISRNSQVYRHADKVIGVGFPQQWRLKSELVNCLGKSNINFASKITARNSVQANNQIAHTGIQDTVAAKSLGVYDAVMIYSGDYTYNQIKEMVAGRQMIIHLPLYASIRGNLEITTGSHRGLCRIDNESYFTKGYQMGDEFTLAWNNTARSSDYSGITPVIVTDDGAIIALEDKFADGKLIAMDFDMLGGQTWSFPDYHDIVLQMLLEGLGCDNVDLGFYLGNWYDYEQFISCVEEFASNYENVSIQDMPYIGNGNKQLKLVTICPSPSKPIIFVETGIHPIEPTGCYGIYGYLSMLMRDYTKNDIWAKTVLDNLEIQWVPVVCAGSFDTYFENPAKMPPFGNTNGQNVNLNRNFEPYEIWQAVEHPHKGTEPFSSPELKNIQWAVERENSRIKVFADYHNTSLHYKGENTYYGVFAHTVSGNRYNEYAKRTNAAFNRRYYYRDFCDYELKESYTSVTFDSSPHIETAQPMSHVYGDYKNIPLSVLIEVWGIRDIHPYQQIGQFDAAATAFEQMLGFELGAVFFNHTSKPKTFKCGLAHINPTEKLKLYIIGKDGQVKETRNITAADEIEVTLQRSQRLIILKPQYNLFMP